MGNQIALQAGSSVRELMALALDFKQCLPANLDQELAGQALERLQSAMISLGEVEPGGVVRDVTDPCGFRFHGEKTTELVNALRPIGILISPGMSPDQAGAWLAAMVAALSDLPPPVAVKAAKDALLVPMRFANEVHGVIRERAVVHQERLEAAIIRLRMALRDLEREPMPAIECHEPRKRTDADYQAMARSRTGRTLLRVGLDAGHITQREYDLAMESASDADGLLT